jgi:hypothetical protein
MGHDEAWSLLQAERSLTDASPGVDGDLLRLVFSYVPSE